MNSLTFFSIVIIGEALRDLPTWRHHSSCLSLFFFQDCSHLGSLSGVEIDFVLLSTAVEWEADGAYSIEQIRMDMDAIRQQQIANHKIILTSIIPVGESETLGCHYAPLSVLTMMNEKRIIGINMSLPIDRELLRAFFSLVLQNPCLFRTTQDAEILYLIEICQLWINQSFQKEIALFCKKSHITPLFLHSSFPRKEMYPVLVYMIRKIEDTKIDCPLLYSCLFRHNYIDINI